ncbi:hypothetical protein OAK32_01430 [Mariniblastus sp.]|nr:hypothetical protein [Mariniblastus sp.]
MLIASPQAWVRDWNFRYSHRTVRRSERVADLVESCIQSGRTIEREYRMIEIHQPEVEQSFAGKLAWQGTTGTTARFGNWIAIDDFKDRADWPRQHAWLTPFNVRTNETNCTQ